MKATLAKELVLDALVMAVWRRKPRAPVLVHSDQGSQYGSDAWLRFCDAHRLVPRMSRKGNCWDTHSNMGRSAASALTHAGIGEMPLR